MKPCRLCKKQKVLIESHIIPKFIGRWLIKTSATGYLRDINKPNLRCQDIIKTKLLCKECEDLLSNDESYFADTIFHPYMNRKSHTYNLPYSKQLSRFCAGLSWRVLIYLTEIHDTDKSSEIENAESTLREYILGNSSNLGIYEQHLIPLEGGAIADFKCTKSNLNAYFTRTIDIDLLTIADRDHLIYIKLPNFILISNINYTHINKMRPSRITLKQGAIISKNYLLPPEFYKYLQDKLNFIANEFTDKISKTQSEKIMDSIKKDPERLLNSRTLKAVESDLHPNQFIFRDPKIPF
ncbi:hypothetical protein HYG93_02085 [Acinetobacter sp. SwsAc6]|uniref:hypothetical protein n=1 Tax=Acinetobacter TaxID=469 RepID=UPI0010C18C81|nr:MULTISPECIES: hypothetical protein [Acinetobacter]NWK73093.1 hypothetical protein [Acinetobacter sp. SwsAc6]QCO21874.1 hypothetical protein C9E88_010470 [Acinetobacter cumulans]